MVYLGTWRLIPVEAVPHPYSWQMHLFHSTPTLKLSTLNVSRMDSEVILFFPLICDLSISQGEFITRVNRNWETASGTTALVLGNRVGETRFLVWHDITCWKQKSRRNGGGLGRMDTKSDEKKIPDVSVISLKHSKKFLIFTDLTWQWGQCCTSFELLQGEKYFVYWEPINKNGTCSNKYSCKSNKYVFKSIRFLNWTK